MDSETLKRRTQQFALRVVRAVEALPNGRASNVIGKSGFANGKDIEELMDEADQLVAIAVSSINTARRNSRERKR